MASKRKRTSPHPAPPKPESIRRSSRRVKTPTSTAIDNKPGSDTDDLANNSTTDIGRAKNEVWKNKESVAEAVRDLGAMEAKLKHNAKKQRLAIENSDLRVKKDRVGSTASKGRYLKSPKGVANQKDKIDPDAAEETPIRDHAVELAEGDVEAAEKEADVVERGAKRAPPVNSETLPLPWSGRLGYACLNTYLRTANPPVFSSRTCRIASILEHRHPLQDPTQPEHATKNRPDKTKPADVTRGMKYVQDLGIKNAQDIAKMLQWNDKYGIKFMRLSSEMFPFASHDEYGYKLAPFASEVLAEAGKVAAKLGHRLTTHPGQFTQLGSPRKEVVTAAIRDLEYHDEMLSLLKLPPQQNRDAVMILHMGGTFGDKNATLDRFRTNYAKLSESVKARLVLENDDVAWTVHDLLPVCEELNIPMVLDYHHHNIMFDPSIREGTLDIIQLYDRIRETWTRKGITQKMHYSEPTPAAVTPRDRRKHSPRVKTLPPCATNMDLMIEAKDKEQAVFELMRTFKLPGWNTFNDVIPHEREDESRKAVMKPKKAKKRKEKKADMNDAGAEEEDNDILVPERIVSAEDFAMGGPDARVYWPEGMEEWLKPKKREVKKKDEDIKTEEVDDDEDLDC